jgi:hypothetical protein
LGSAAAEAGPLGPVYDVRAFGAAGDGATDDTAAINRTFVAARRGGVVLFPPAAYRVAGVVTIAESADVAILGYGATLALAPSAPFGLQLVGVNVRLTVWGLRILGTGVLGDDQCGIGTRVSPAEGTRTTDCRVADCEIGGVVRGVYLDVRRLGDVERPRIEANFLHDLVGTGSGQGYGIVLSGCVHGLIAGNRVERAQRHSIYLSVSQFVHVTGNSLRWHREGIGTNSQLCALTCARSSFVSMTDNFFERCAEGAVSIEPHETDPSHVSRGVSVIGNKFVDSSELDIFVGGASPAASGCLSDVIIADNLFCRSASGGNDHDSIRVFHGRRVRIAGNTFVAEGRFGNPYSLIVLSAAVDPRFTDQVVIEGNAAFVATDGAPAALVAVAPALCGSGQRIHVGRNDFACDGTTGAPAFLGVSVTGEGLSVEQPDGVRELCYAPVVRTPSIQGRFFRLDVPAGGNCIIADPDVGVLGMTLHYEIRSELTGRLGKIAWGPAFRLSGALRAPARGKRLRVIFLFDGGRWVETSRGEMDP